MTGANLVIDIRLRYAVSSDEGGKHQLHQSDGGLGAMLNTIPLQLQDGWSIASPIEANLDEQPLTDLTRWIEETYEHHNTNAVLIEHAGRLVYELYLKGQDGYFGDRVFNVNSLHDLRSISKSVTSLLLGIALQGEYERALATP